ncbi:MAG: ferredoxin--NADP reductase [Xanthomonadales bacterium]|nr:ferredoxin--NADP reductase [Xanthomonadales bacterium]
MSHFPLTLTASRELAPGVHHYSFQRSDGEPMRYLPGQFIQVHFQHEGVLLRRSYSIATVPTQDEAAHADTERLVEIAVSFVPGGAATALFENLQPGEEIQASGPFGRFVLHEADRNQRYLLLATGTGVTPYRSMLPLIAERIAQRGQRFVLLFGARSPAELLYGDEFQAFAEATPGFVFHPCFSRSGRQPPGPDDRRGYVQGMLAELAPDPDGDIAYLCGNPDMVDAGFAALKEAGLPIPHIRREKYVSPPAPRRPPPPTPA